MDAEMTAIERAEKIFDMICHYENYDGRLDNTENYLMAKDGAEFGAQEEVVAMVAEKLRGDSIAAKMLLEDIIGGEHEGALVVAHDAWVEAAIERTDAVAKRMGLGIKPPRLEMEPEALSAGMTMQYLYDEAAFERLFLVADEAYQEDYGMVCRVRLLTQPPVVRYLPTRALKCAAKSHEVLRAINKLGFQGRMA